MSEKVYSNNGLVSARYDMSATELNVFILLLYEMKRRQFKGNYYTISLQSLREFVPEVKYYHVKEAAQKMISRSFQVDEGGRWLALSFISSAEYKKQTALLEIGVDTKTLAYYKDLSRYTTFELETALQSKSKYTKRLYQVLSRFKSTGYWIVNLVELKKMLGLIDERTGKEKYKSYSLFVQKVIEVAQEELNQAEDLKFTWEVHSKTGKRVEVLRFNILPSEKKAGILEHNLVEALKGYSLAPWQAEIIAARVAPEDIERTLTDIRNIAQRSPETINNIGGYTLKCFEQNYKLDFSKKPEA